MVRHTLGVCFCYAGYEVQRPFPEKNQSALHQRRHLCFCVFYSSRPRWR